MKFYLKNDRSEQFSYFTDKWYCVGRENEIQSLQHILKNLNSSSILISGVRWTWKTSFVHKSIKWLCWDKFSPIFINLKDIKNPDDWTNTHLLTSIIRATYLSGENLEKKEDLEQLYYNSLWKFEKFQEYTNDENEEEQEKKTRSEMLEFSGTISDVWKLIWYCSRPIGLNCGSKMTSSVVERFDK